MGAMFWKALIILVLSVAIFGTAGFFLYDIFIAPTKRAEADSALPLPTPPPDPSLAAFAAAEALFRAGDKAAARAALAEFLEDFPDSPRLDAARSLLGPLNMERLLSREDMEGKETYTVQRGDAVARIERRFKMPAELLMRVNGIPDPTKLAVGQVLLIVRPDFSIEIERDRQRVVLLDGGRFFKEYRPVAWNPSPTKLPDRVQTRVNDKIAWKEGERIAFGAKGYAEALRWVGVAQPGWTLYAEPPAAETKANKPPHGIGLSPEDASEIASLVSWGTPVTIR